MTFLVVTKTTTTTMNEVIVIESDDSENSIVEVEVPRKPTPPLIYVEDEDIILNIRQKSQTPVLAKDFINKDQELTGMPKRAKIHDINSPSHWTPDMVKFYDDDWGDEDQFIVENLQKSMDKSPALWKISKKDESKKQNKLGNHITCWNCGDKGHTVSFCPDPPHLPKCHMCGTEGHVEYSCPNARCLNCGNFSKSFVTCCIKCKKQKKELCSRCRIFGHNFINCPDHWRLFHLTIGTTSVIVPEKNIYKSDKDMWCCNCGKKGHYQIHCMIRKDCKAFQDSLPFVVSYQKAFRDGYFRNKKNDPCRKKNKRNKKNEDKVEALLKINSLNKPIRKGKVLAKRKFKMLKKR